jgi:glutamate-ammonia-ligase adenylyltransferase
LYEVDARLRPTGKSGPLATSLEGFARYFAEGAGQLWEQQALCKARVAHGSQRVADAVLAAVTKATFSQRWRRSNVDEIRQMRRRLEETTTPGDLKRGYGGIVDVEFLVQMLQLKHGRRRPKLRQPNTIAALDELRRAGCLEPGDHEFFSSAYRTLRTIEGRLRLMNSTARDTLPEDPVELTKLAQLLSYPSGQALLKHCRQLTEQTRRRFEMIFEREGGSGPQK